METLLTRQRKSPRSRGMSSRHQDGQKGTARYNSLSETSHHQGVTATAALTGASEHQASRLAGQQILRAGRQQRKTRSTLMVGTAAGWVTVLGLAGTCYPQAEAFFTGTQRFSMGMGGAAFRGFRVGGEGGQCRGRFEVATRMSSEEPTLGSIPGKPQFMSSPEMEISDDEVDKPPDREAALKMIAAREEEDQAKGNLGTYYSADIPNIPQPPYYFQVPGESGNDTLCTDSAWHAVLLAFGWLGMPFETKHEEDEDQPMMAMGSELYDDPVQLLSSLPERTLLSDFVESETHITKAVSRVEPAWKAVLYNTKAGKSKNLEKELGAALEKVEDLLVRTSPKGNMLEGEDLTIGDFRLAVTMYHMTAAFATDKQWKMPDNLKNLKGHMALMHDMQVFKIVMPSMDILMKKYAEST